MSVRPILLLRFKKTPDAAAVLTCVRADGTSTWTRIGASDGFGPLHDLAHYVVEGALGLRGGFLGLLARGWEIGDFESGAAARLVREPDGWQAFLAEGLAGLLSQEAAAGQALPLAEYHRAAEKAGPIALSAADLERCRASLAALRARWDALAPGETLELSFEPARPAGSA